MRENQVKAQQKAIFQEKVLSVFEQSLTEEQRFLQGILTGDIKTYSHEEVMIDLRKALQR